MESDQVSLEPGQAPMETSDASLWQVQAIRAAVKKADSAEARFIPHARVVARVKQLSRKLFEPGW